MRTPLRAFTLIELLVVVSVIAILAAIALPNFLEAQVRAKVARTKADMRAVATAMDTYRIDAGAWAIPSDNRAQRIIDPVRAVRVSPFETRVPVSLTTPIAYLSALPEDVFASSRHSESRVYHTITTDYVRMRAENAPRHNWNLIWFRFFRQLLGEAPPAPIEYMLVSWGPDEVHDADVPDLVAPVGPHEHNRASIYDPTNGTISSGDILYFGPSMGFP